jgi:DNA-binding response OmpR family regulator
LQRAMRQSIGAWRPADPLSRGTSDALSGEKKKARSAGCGNYVPKPFSPRQLLAKIRQYLCQAWHLIAAVHESAVDAVDGSSTGTRVPKMWALLVAPTIRRSSPMQTVSTIGLDIAKSVFQVHGVDANGQVVTMTTVKKPKTMKSYHSRAFPITAATI